VANLVRQVLDDASIGTDGGGDLIPYRNLCGSA